MSGKDADTQESSDTPWHDPEKLRHLYHDEGMTMAEVGDELGCSKGAVTYQMKKHGIERRNPNDGRYDDEPWRDADVLRQKYVGEQMTMAEVGDELGCTAKTVHTWLNRHEIETRELDPAGRDETPWRDADTLRCLYFDKEMSQTEIADELGCRPSVISVWMNRLGIETRSKSEAVSLAWGGGSDHLDPETLTEFYVDREWPMARIADHFGIDDSTVFHHLNKHGIETRKPASAPKYDDALAARHVYYGPNWRAQSEARREKDGYECSLCPMTNERHLEQHGHQLHVHHLVPLRRFYDGETKSIDYERANRMDNLMTLCQSCHSDWEGVPLRPQS